MFRAANPTISFEFDSLQGAQIKSLLQSYSPPQIVETRYGKSMLFANTNQLVTLNQTHHTNPTCFDDLDLCTNGYTLKLLLCFTNYNLLKQAKSQSPGPVSSNKLIYILTKTDMHMMYDLNESKLKLVARDDQGEFKSSVDFDLKLYMWYTITVTFERRDGLRVYVNNELLDHVVEIEQSEFVNVMDFTIGKNVKVGGGEVVEAQSNYYEFIVHRMVQYDSRKYPDEIVGKKRVFKGNFI